MLVRLKNFIKPSTQNEINNLKKLGLNQTQHPLCLESIVNLYYNLSPDKKNQFISYIFEGITSECWVYQIKCYMVIHEFIITLDEPSFENRLIMTQYKEYLRQQKTDTKQWIRAQLIKPYHNYLIKVVLNANIYEDDNEKKQSLRLKQQFIEQINVLFKYLNIMREMLNLKIIFQKLGRYYPEYVIIISLFKMYLRDMKQYYNKIKRAMTYIFDFYYCLDDEEIVHGFYFINEALSISDRQYQFFYNRYFYPKMLNYDFPKFYKLDYQKYNSLQKNLHNRKIFITFTSYPKKQKQRNNKSYFNKTTVTEQNIGTAETVQNYQTFGNFQFDSHGQVVDDIKMILNDQ